MIPTLAWDEAVGIRRSAKSEQLNFLNDEMLKQT
jgi:hypothetical protein